MVQQLIRYGFVEEAYQELKPMVAGVVDGGFREWWTPDGRPRGVPRYRGSAGVLGRAVEMLLDWARQQPRVSEPGEVQTANAR